MDYCCRTVPPNMPVILFCSAFALRSGRAMASQGVVRKRGDQAVTTFSRYSRGHGDWTPNFANGALNVLSRDGHFPIRSADRVQKIAL
jgi:hypothetical protein